jgi:flagellar hook-associated protein 3 FlgL
MRVTSNTYSNLVISSSQNAQQQLAQLQQEISSGNTVQYASDDPLVYQQASQTQASLAQLNAYTSVASTATTQTTQNNSAMTSLHQLVAQAGEYATGITSNMSTSEMADVGTEMNSLLSQITSIANQTDTNGNYMFGGTSNKAPIDTTTGTYGTGTNGQTTSIDVQQGNSVQTSIVAGSPGSGTSGFLYDASTGVDVIAAIKQAVTDLNSGNGTAVQSTDIPALNKALDLVSSYVGSTAASMAAVSTATTSLQTQITAKTNTLNNLTQTNLPTATLQLQQIQTQYQAALEAGSRILNLNILNYIGSVSSS